MENKDNFDQDLINKRFLASNEVLLKAYENFNKHVDVNDPEFTKKLGAITRLHEQIILDEQNETNAAIEAEKIRVEEEKNEMDKVLESERLEDERERSKANVFLEKLKIAVSATVGIGGLGLGLYKFIKSTEKEEDEAYLTVTQKETVREGLRDPSERKWKLW